MTNINNIEDDFQTWFWNKSANKNNSNSEKKDNNRHNRDDENLEEEYFKIKAETSFKVLKQELM